MSMRAIALLIYCEVLFAQIVKHGVACDNFCDRFHYFDRLKGLFDESHG